MNATYNTTTDSLREMFLDATAGESASGGRLKTEELPNGNVGLVGYNWLLLAEIEPATGTVTVYDGHAGNVSKTTTRHINEITADVKNHETREYTRSTQTPILRNPPKSANYIGEYIGAFANPKSPQDMRAMSDVTESL